MSDLYVVVHAQDGPWRYIKGFGEDKEAAEEHSEQMGESYEVQHDGGSC